MPGAKYFCFMVDDMVFFKDFDIEDSVQALLNSPEALAVHLKLYAGITYSHTNNKLMGIPKLVPAFPESMKWLKFKRENGKMDWNYPFDFCGSIYRLENVL